MSPIGFRKNVTLLYEINSDYLKQEVHIQAQYNFKKLVRNVSNLVISIM